MFVQNLPALAVLFGTASLLTAGAILVAGFLPIHAHAAPQGRAMLGLLVLLAGTALAACAVMLLVWCLEALPVSWSVIAAGLGLLTGPLLFQMLPRRATDHPFGLICTAGLGLAIGFVLLGLDPI